MVHHLFFFRPIRTLIGLLLLAGAIVCFLRAVERSRFDMADSRWMFHEGRGARGEGRVSTAAADKKTDSTEAPLPNPPPPAGDGKSSKPDWVGKPGHLESRGGLEVYVTTATAGPYSTTEECDRALDGEIDRVVTDFAEKELPQAVAGTVKLDRDLIENHLIQRRYRETVDSPSVGPMQQQHVLLVFDRTIRAAIEQQWRAIQVAKRLQFAAIGSGAVLLVLGGVYSLLRWKPAAS